MSDYSVTSAAGQKMMSYLPRYYETSRIMSTLNQARGMEIDKFRQALDETLNQFYVRTSTWGLDDWEKELNLLTDTSLTDSERQDRIVSKLRGYGICTLKLIKTTAEAYEYGTVNAVQDHAIYRIIIQYVDVRGVPSNIDDLKKVLREIIPANLEIQYEYKYTTYNELKTWGLTYGAIKDLGLTYGAIKIYRQV